MEDQDASSLPINMTCLGEWCCGKSKMILSKRNNRLILESGGNSSTMRYVVPIGSSRDATFPMRWAVTKDNLCIGDPPPNVADTVYILELVARTSKSLLVKKPFGQSCVEFTRPGYEPTGAASSTSARRPRSRSRSRSRSNRPDNGQVPLPVLFSSGETGHLVPPPGVQMAPGDWFCSNCEAHNFSRNKSCHECTTWKPGCEPGTDDWICPKCKANNFRKANTCRGCAGPRPGSENTKEVTQKEGLVGTIKRRQRESQVFKQRWYAFCDAHAGGFYDPVKHDVALLKHFMDNIF